MHRMDFTAVAVMLGFCTVLGACATKDAASAGSSALNHGVSTGFTREECTIGRQGWMRGQGITRDVAPPCGTSSGGRCLHPAYEYVPGTGWCRPIVFASSRCRDGYSGWIKGLGITRDLVGPCRTSSGGRCPREGYEYVSGTGWCRPTYFTKSICRHGLPGWVRAKGGIRDVAAPCLTSSKAVCGLGFEYLPGTGWCQPLELLSEACDRGNPTWTRGLGVSRDAVEPCGTSSVGRCHTPNYVYVPGTGWCRPQAMTIRN